MKNGRDLGIALVTMTFLLAPAAVAGAVEEKAPPLDGKSAFESLKRLAGEWTGTPETPDATPEQVQYRVVSNGTTVMETLFPGTEHEMISMYHMDGRDLVMTHYCSAGNQPRFRLKKAASSPSAPIELVFDFAGGTNLNPRKDLHIHSVRLVFMDENHIQAEWQAFENGKPSHTKQIAFSRNRS